MAGNASRRLRNKWIVGTEGGWNSSMCGVFLAEGGAMQEKLVMIKSPFQFCYEVLYVSRVCGHFCSLKLTRCLCYNSYTGTRAYSSHQK